VEITLLIKKPSLEMLDPLSLLNVLKDVNNNLVSFRVPLFIEMMDQFVWLLFTVELFRMKMEVTF